MPRGQRHSSEFYLDYLSNNGVDDVLGKGWNFPQYLRLLRDSGGVVRVASGQNTIDTFLPSGGGYVADPYTCTWRRTLARPDHRPLYPPRRRWHRDALP